MDDGRPDDKPPPCRVWTGLVLCGAVLLAGCTAHPTAPPGAPTSDTERPALLIDEFQLPDDAFDAGELPDDRATSWTFTLRNVGSMPLVVAGVSDSCGGCLEAITDRTMLAAGQATPLHVTYDPRTVDEFGRDVRHIIRVKSDDPDHPVAEFHLRARLPGQPATEAAASTADARRTPPPRAMSTTAAAQVAATGAVERATWSAYEERLHNLAGARQLRDAYSAGDVPAAQAVLQAWHAADPPIAANELAALPPDWRAAYAIMARFYTGPGWSSSTKELYLLPAHVAV